MAWRMYTSFVRAARLFKGIAPGRTPSGGRALVHDPPPLSVHVRSVRLCQVRPVRPVHPRPSTSIPSVQIMSISSVHVRPGRLSRPFKRARKSTCESSIQEHCTHTYYISLQRRKQKCLDLPIAKMALAESHSLAHRRDTGRDSPITSNDIPCKVVAIRSRSEKKKYMRIEPGSKPFRLITSKKHHECVRHLATALERLIASVLFVTQTNNWELDGSFKRFSLGFRSLELLFKKIHPHLSSAPFFLGPLVPPLLDPPAASSAAPPAPSSRSSYIPLPQSLCIVLGLPVSGGPLCHLLYRCR